MIIFHNPGLIPLDAIRLMGASVKTAGSFGRFGTGFKYAVATILRGGGEVSIWRGSEHLTFALDKVEMKGETFEEVLLQSSDHANTTRLGFTTALGKDWEPWMALRELACNARDEGGDWCVWEDEGWGPSGIEDQTEIVVVWDDMDDAARGNEAGVFVPDKPLLADDRGVRVLEGPSQYLYHRGVRVWKLPRPAVFTYDITAPVELTEDRTVKYSFAVAATVRNALLNLGDRDVIRGAVTARQGKSWEAGWDWTGKDYLPAEPGQTWLEVVAEARNNSELSHTVSESARNVLLKHQAFRKSEQATWIDHEGANERLSDAAEIIEELGFPLKDVNVFISDALPGEALSAVNQGSIFLTPQLLDARVIVIVRELIRRLLELKGEGDHDKLLVAATERLFDIALSSHYRLKRERELFTEEVQAGSVADALLIAMDVRGEDYPVRPSELVEPPAPAPVHDLDNDLNDDVPF